MTVKKTTNKRSARRKPLSPEEAMLINKLVRPEAETKSQTENRLKRGPNDVLLHQVSQSTSMSNRDADNLFQVLPEMEFISDILVSSILAPGDMISTEIIYSFDQEVFPAEVIGPVKRLIEDEFTNVYKIKDVLYDVVRDVLFRRGSYPLIVLPETAIDVLINSDTTVSNESLANVGYRNGHFIPYGVLGSGTSGNSSALESLTNVHTVDGSVREITYSNEKIPLGIEVVDNPDILKSPTLVERVRTAKVTNIYRSHSVALESMDARRKSKSKLSPKDIEAKYYKPRVYHNTPLSPVLTRKQVDRPNIGAPIVMHLPNESVIPVHIPGNRRHHIGYFVLIDHDGNAITNDLANNYYDDAQLLQMAGQQSSMGSKMLEQIKAMRNGRSCSNGYLARELILSFTGIVENDLKNRLQSGSVGGNYDIAATEEVMRLMLGRSLAQKRTKLLYVPVELLIYVAVDYNQYGIGKSMIEDAKILGALRSLLLFADTQRAVKNATDNQTIEIEIDEMSEDPMGDAEFMLSEYMRLQPGGIPINSNNPLDHLDFLARAGRSVNITGNEKLPTTRFDVSERSGTHGDIDSDLVDNLRQAHYQTFGLSSELIDAAGGVDFAAQIITQNVLLLKRVIRLGDRISPHISRFLRTYVLNHGTLMEDIEDLLKENKEAIPKEYRSDIPGCAEMLISSLKMSFIRPETDKLAEQMEAFGNYKTAIEEALDAYLYEGLGELVEDDGEFNTALEKIKPSIINILLRDYLVKNNILPEMDFLTSHEEESGPLAKVSKDAIRYAKRMKRILKPLIDLNAEEEEEDGDMPMDEGDGGDDGGDEGMSMDDGGESGDDDDGDIPMEDDSADDVSESDDAEGAEEDDSGDDSGDDAGDDMEDF